MRCAFITIFALQLVFVPACGPSKTEQRHQRELEAAKVGGEKRTTDTIRTLQNGRFDPEEFSALAIGMTYDRASAHLGGPGVETATAKEGTAISKTYEWGDGAISATFVDDRLTRKSKR
jgi:hypothetical protein